MKKKELYQMIAQEGIRIFQLRQELEGMKKDFYALRQHYMQKEKIEDDRVFYPSTPQYPSKGQDVDYTVTCDSRFTAIDSGSGTLSSDERRFIVTPDNFIEITSD